MADRLAPLDLGRLLGVLDRCGVEFVVIGGLAAIAHGSRRMTLDVDVVPRPDAGNFVRLASAVRELGVAEGVVADGRFQDIDPHDGVDLARSRNISLRTEAGRLDVVNAAKGVPPYEELDARAVVVDIAGVAVRVVGADDLLALKRASGCPKDLQDIADITSHELD